MPHSRIMLLREINDGAVPDKKIKRAANYCAANQRIGTEYLPLLFNM